MSINLPFWIFVLLAFIGTSLYYLGEKSKGNLSEIIKFSGGILTIGILITSFFLSGWKLTLLLIAVEFTIISFVSAMVVNLLKK